MRPLLGKRFLYSNFIDMINSILISIGRKKARSSLKYRELQSTTASGRAFPIWNTVDGDNTLLSLSIHGLTEQIGTPTPENPVPMRSVGDSGLFLSVMPDKAGSDYQLLNIKAAMKKAGHDGILRSVNGIYDEVVYNGKKWKLIQRIGVLDNIPEMGILFKDATYTDKQLFRFQFKTSEPKNFCATGQILSDIFITATGWAMNNQPLNSCWSNYARENVHYIYFNVPLEYDTVEKAIAYLGENYEIYYPLYTPIEYPLDLPVITTYDEQTYFASNAAEVKPRMVAQCQVSKALDYIREGLIGYYTGRGRSNTDENKNILPDLSGNGNDLENKNFAYTPESGYGDGYIQYDGVDDFSNVAWTDVTTKSVLLVCEDIVNTKQSPYYSLTSMIGNDRSLFGGISNGKIPANNIYGYFNSSNLGSELYTKDFSLEKGILNIYLGNTGGLINNPEYVYNLCIGAGNFYANPPRYSCKVKIYDFLAYTRKLTDEEIEHNYKVSCQYNGEDFSFDPIKQNLVASYRAYDKTNEDQDRDILKDLSGNGHDIQLYNFAFSEGSGYGKYATDFTKWGNLIADLVTKNKFVFTKASTGSSYVIVLRNNPVLNSFKIKASGFIGNNDFLNYRYYKDGSLTTYKISTNGIHTLPASDGTNEIGFLSYNIQSEITIEQIPEYQGALVSDGVDDYGLCENFPAMNIENGYTVCAIRKWLEIDLSVNIRFITEQGRYHYGNFCIETIISGIKRAISFNNLSIIDFDENLNFIYQTSNNYNGTNIYKGSSTSFDGNLGLFKDLAAAGNYKCSKMALYALEIYNRDLTDEEIAKVKAKMIAEYEEKTGNKYEEE